jgi:hypothetical protein
VGGDAPQYFLLPKNNVLFCKVGGMLMKLLQQRKLLFDGLDYMALKQVNDTTQGRRPSGILLLDPRRWDHHH